MNFPLLFVAIVPILLLCHKTEQLDSVSGSRNDTKANGRIMKAFLMQCPVNATSNNNNIQVTVKIVAQSTCNKNNTTHVGRMFLGDLSDFNQNVACDLKDPSLVEVSSDNFVLMYPFQFATTISDTTALGDNFVEAGRVIRARQNSGAKTNNNRVDHSKAAVKDVHTANNVKLLDDIYNVRLKPSDFLKRSDFMHTNPKDFRRDSICTKNFRKDNNKNNANNEYANEEFYGDKNQRENAFSGIFGMNLNNNEIDNIKSNKGNDNEKNVVNDIGYFAKNLFDDKDTWKRRKKIKEHKNDFIKCVGMKNFKKIDHILCTCARRVDEVNGDETENNDEQSDCFQLINNVCLWGPVYNKNINYEMKMNEDDIRNVNFGNIKSTAFACCDLLPPFYFTLGIRCYNIFLKDDVSVEFDGKLFDELPEIIKNESDEVLDEVLDETTSYLRSKNERNEKMTDIHRSESILSEPQHNLHSGNLKLYQNKEMRNHLNNDRRLNIETAPFYDTVDDIVKSRRKPKKERNFRKKEAKPFDKVIYDPHLNIADKIQLIDMINPKRPCERNRMNSQLSIRNRQKRNFDLTDQSASLTDDELDSALENYEDSDSKFEFQDGLKSDDGPNKYSKNPNEAVRMVKKICSQHSCSIAMPFRKDPFYRGEIKFFDNNGSNLNSIQIAENLCHDHFHEFILIPFDYANNNREK